jgi:hypothetical protein
MIKVKLILLFTFASSFLNVSSAKAYVVHETEPGILEIKGIDIGQTLVVEKVFVDKKKNWIYIGVKEVKIQGRFPAQLTPADLDSSEKIRYFYAKYTDIKVKPGQKMKALQFGIERRVLNQRGKIPFGGLKFFYPLIYFERHS